MFRERYPDFPAAFLPQVLGQRPHPLKRSSEEQEKHAVSRLFLRWADLNEACRWVKEHIALGEMAFVDGFGLDAYLDAIACKDCKQQKDEAFMLHHHGLVQARIVYQKIRPPIYFIPRAPRTDVSERLATFHVSLEFEMERYFNNTGQNPPIFLEGGSVKECAEEILAHVMKGNRK
ncbi:MAG: hypothetical protein ACHQU0_02750 [Candidatus Paceibacteria bacterium]